MTSPDAHADRGGILTIGTGTALAMWSLLYVIMMPAAAVAPALAVAVMALCLLGGGYLLGRLTGAGWAGGLRLGLLIGGVDLLILGSVVNWRGAEQMGMAAAWSAIAVLGSMALAAVGAVVGREASPVARARQNWTGRLAVVTATATFVLIVAGGVVTSLEAGLAIRGWLTADGYPLVLFPLRLMQAQGGKYAEHAHRLLGLLVGLTTIALVVQVRATDGRRWLRRLAIGLLAAVIVQGVMGGSRVTETSVTLAIIHGIFAQVLFAATIAVAVVTSSTWSAPRFEAPAGGRAALVLLHLVVLQLVLGAMYRHLNDKAGVPVGLVHGTLGGHLLGAIAVIVAAIVAGGRAAVQKDLVLRRHGGLLLAAVALQAILGVAALIAVLGRGDAAEVPLPEAALTAAHHAVGAMLLGLATGLAVWART